MFDRWSLATRRTGVGPDRDLDRPGARSRPRSTLVTQQKTDLGRPGSTFAIIDLGRRQAGAFEATGLGTQHRCQNLLLAGSGSMSQHLKQHYRYLNSYRGAEWVGFQHGEARRSKIGFLGDTQFSFATVPRILTCRAWLRIGKPCSKTVITAGQLAPRPASS